MQVTTRKGLPLPEVTDIAGTNYTVGPVGRTITTTGKVRDTERAVSSLLDTFVEYNQDEIISGRFEFQSPTITDKGSGQLFQNNTGAQRVLGDVVIVDPANDSGIILPNAAGVSAGKVGVVAETINAAAVGRVVFSGFVRVKVAGGVVRNQYLTTQNASVIAAGGTYQTTGSFALSVTSQDINNMVLAVLHPGSGLEGGGTINGGIGLSAGNHLAVGSPTALGYIGIIVNDTINADLTTHASHGINSSPTLVAQTNGDILAGVVSNPVFNDNGKTGVIHYGVYSGTGNNYFAGAIGVGAVPSGNAGISVSGALSTGSTQYGIFSSVTFASAVNSANGISSVVNTVNGFTSPAVAQIRAQGVSFGTTQTISNLYGIYVDPVAAPSGITNNYGVYINDVTGGATENVSLVSLGLTRFKAYTCKVFNSNTLGYVTNSPVAFDSESYKTVTSMHSTSTNNSRMIAPINGKYRITANLTYAASNLGTFRGASIVINGSITAANVIQPAVLDGVNITAIVITTEATLNSGDFVEIYAQHNTGGSLNINNTPVPTAEMTLVSI
jgi:hypothetical protein